MHVLRVGVGMDNWLVSHNRHYITHLICELVNVYRVKRYGKGCNRLHHAQIVQKISTYKPAYWLYHAPLLPRTLATGAHDSLAKSIRLL